MPRGPAGWPVPGPPPAPDPKTWALMPPVLSGGLTSYSHVALPPPTLHPEPRASRASASRQPASTRLKNPSIQSARKH